MKQISIKEMELFLKSAYRPKKNELILCLVFKDADYVASVGVPLKNVSSNGKVFWMHRILVSRSKIDKEGGECFICKKAVLLHEIGHLKTVNPEDILNGIKSNANLELAAQMWAIEKAKRMRWTRLYDHSVYKLKSWEKREGVYAEAYQLAKTKGLI